VTRTLGQSAGRTAGTSSKRTTATAGRTLLAPQWRFVIPVLKIGGIAAFVVLLVVGLLYVRLLHGPIALGFLASPIERAIREEAAGLGVRIEGVAARLGEKGQLEFELTNLRVTDADDVLLAAAPSATVSLSRRALLGGRIAPESVNLISPRLVLYYNESGTLSLKFSSQGDSGEGERPAAAALRGSVEPALPAAPAATGAEGAIGRIDLIQVLSQASARARRREHAGAYLREIGLRAATVLIDNGTRKSIWRVPELDVDLDHRRSRSSIAGRAKIDSLSGPWTVNFRTFEREDAKDLQLAVSVQGLVPRGLARTLPQLAGLESLDVPVWGDARLELSNTGEVLSGTIDIDAAPGQVLLPWLSATPFRIDGGHLALSYSRQERRFDVAPSVLLWGDSRLQFTGSVAHTMQGAEGPGWAFELKSAGGWLGAEPPLLQRLMIDDWSARGFLAPEAGRVVLSQFLVRAGGAEVSAQGDVTDMAGAMKAQLDGRIGPMPAAVFKSLWPSALAPRTRDWVVTRLARGSLQGGSFRLASGAGSATAGWAATSGRERGSLTLEGANLAFNILDGWPALEVPRALVRLDEQTFELTAPDAWLGVPDGRRLALSRGTFSIDMKEPLPRTGHISFRAQGPVALAAELLDREPLRAFRDSGVAISGIEGKVDGQLTLSMPLGEALHPRDVRVEGKARISDGRLPKALGPYDVTGAGITVEMTGSAAEARGEMLVNGVPAKIAWQHVHAAPPEKQPPARFTARLDNADRTQLGLDINDLVQGEVGVEVTVARDAQGERQVHLRADLNNAEILLDSVAWRKPKGRPSVFQFDVIKGGTLHPIELHNVKLVGDSVAIEGWMGIGADNKVREFRFPTFSLNVVTSLEAYGKMRADGIWEVVAKGPTYDGRDLFRSFFDVAYQADPNSKVRPGLDLRAEVATVVGYSDSALRNVKMTLQKRSNKLVALDVRGALDGGKPFAAVLEPQSGQPRRLRAEAIDAGQLFKLVGFYPNAVGGIMNLEVNLDGKGPADRTGTLWTRKFRVLGDPIISEVLQNTDDGQSTQGGRRKMQRQQFDFDLMKVPFSVGHGQFVMHDAVINGPLEGATLRGTIDFRSQYVDLGGTYVGGAGIMQALAPIPIIGPLVTGPRGEGIFGITYAIKGPMSKPQVVVNPLSLLTPGIFREIFQMTPDDPRVLPRERPAPRGDGAARSSSVPATGPAGAPAELQANPGVGSSWPVETRQPPPKRK